MGSTVSSEKPKSISVLGVVDAIRRNPTRWEKSIARRWSGDRAHGSASHVAWLVREGWVQVLFAGNALATHDIEQALYGTSLGVSLTHGEPLEHGHEHHLRAINSIRRLGGIAGRSRSVYSTPGSCMNASGPGSTWSWLGRSAMTVRCPR